MENANQHDHSIRTQAEDAVDPRIDLAVERTSLALERTQLAWVRTILTFITAGIAIDRGTAALQKARIVSGVAWSESGHFAGLLLTITSTILMITVTVLYIRRMRQLNKMRGITNKLPAPATALSVFVCLLGALFSYLLNIPW